MAFELDREFSKAEVQMASKYMKKCSTFLVIEKLQVKTKLISYLTAVRMTILRAIATTNTGEEAVKKEFHFGGNEN
jgi:hypothetical protein